MRRGNAFARISLCVCLSVCLSVCLTFCLFVIAVTVESLKIHQKLIFGMQVHRPNIQVKFVCHRVKVKVTGSVFRLRLKGYLFRSISCSVGLTWGLAGGYSSNSTGTSFPVTSSRT